MAELQRLRGEQNRVTDESVESTRRMLKLSEEAETVGSKSLVQLKEQREQLENIDKAQDIIKEDMMQTEKTLLRMEKGMLWFMFCECCGMRELTVNPRRSSSDKAKEERIWTQNQSDSKVATRQPQQRNNGPHNQSAAPSGGYVKKITNDEREDEMEQNMGDIANIVGNLRNIALDMSGQLETQNSHLDRINAKAEFNEERVKEANTRAGKLLK